MNFLSDPGARFRAILAAMVAGITMTASLCAVDFVTQIEPVLREHCSRCHGPETQKGRFRVDLRSTLIRGGESGEPAIQIGDPSGAIW